jgi:hypothetical protein
MVERSSVMAFAMMLLLAGPQPAAAATVTINAKLQDDAIDIHASAMLNADAATAWRVLTDYDHYAEFIPDLSVSRVIARNGATVTAEQSGSAEFWLFKLLVHATFEVNGPRTNLAAAGASIFLAIGFVRQIGPVIEAVVGRGRFLPGRLGGL